jgi:protein pelota
VLKSDEVKAKLSDTKFARESRAVDEFYKMIGIDEQRAYYGPKHVARAVEAGAVGTLLISDSLFRLGPV